MGYLDGINTRFIDRLCNLCDMVKSILMPNGMHTVAQGDILNIKRRIHGARLPSAMDSAALTAAEVMMSRLPA